MSRTPPPITECQRQEITNLFTKYTAQQLGLQHAQYSKLYHDQKVLNKSPEEVFMNLVKFRRSNKSASRQREQDEEMAREGFTAKTLTPLKENENRRVEVTYDESEGACKYSKKLRSSLGGNKYKKGKKRDIQFSEEEHVKHYIPGKKIRGAIEDEPEPIVASRIPISYWRAKDMPPLLREQLKPQAEKLKTVKKKVMLPRFDPEDYEPPPEVCHTPRQIRPIPCRKKTKRAVLTKEEEEEDKVFLRTYLNPIRIPASTPIQHLENLPSGSVIQIVQD